MVSRIVWHLVSNRWNSAVTEFAISAARALEGLGYQNIISPKNQSPAHNLALRHDFLLKPLEDFKTLTQFCEKSGSGPHDPVLHKKLGRQTYFGGLPPLLATGQATVKQYPVGLHPT